MKGRTVLSSGLKAWVLSLGVRAVLGMAYPAGTPAWGSAIELALFAAFAVNVVVFAFWNLSALLRCDEDHRPAVTAAWRPGAPLRIDRQAGMTVTGRYIYGREFTGVSVTTSGGQLKYVVPARRPVRRRRGLLGLLPLSCPDCNGSGYACITCDATGRRYAVEAKDAQLIIRDRAAVRSRADRQR